MNHTERIAETARRHRHLTRRMAKEVIETYLELLAEEIAQGDWVDIYGIGKLKIGLEVHSTNLRAKNEAHKLKLEQVRSRLRTQIRLFGNFKGKCYEIQKQ